MTRCWVVRTQPRQTTLCDAAHHSLAAKRLSTLLPYLRLATYVAAGGGAINRSRLVQLLVFVARDEEAAYKRRSVSVLCLCLSVCV